MLSLTLLPVFREISNRLILAFMFLPKYILFVATAAVLQLLRNSGRQVTAQQLLKSQSLIRRKGMPIILHKVSSNYYTCCWLPNVVLLTIGLSSQSGTQYYTGNCPLVHHLFQSEECCTISGGGVTQYAHHSCIYRNQVICCLISEVRDT